MDTNIAVNIQEYNFKENLNAINYKFKNILEDLYSDSSVKKDHVPPLKTIYKSYIENKSYTDVILRHISFPVFLAILIDIDIDRLEDFLRSTSPALNINRTYLCNFNSLELVRLWVEEIIFEYLRYNCWFDKDMLLDILNQFKNIFHGRCEYIIKYYDQFIEFKQNIYSIDRIKNCTNDVEHYIRNASEEFSKFILFDSYKTCITNFNEYIQYYDLIPEVLDINKIRDMHKSDNNEYECRLGMKVKTNDDLMSKVDYLEEAIEVDTNNDNCSNEESDDDNVDEKDFIAPEDGVIDQYYENLNSLILAFDNPINSKLISDDFGPNPNSKFFINASRRAIIINNKHQKNISLYILKQEISPNIKEGYRFKKGELLIKRYVDNEISQKDIELINKSLNNSDENWTPVVKDIVKDISIGNIEEIKEES